MSAPIHFRAAIPGDLAALAGLLEQLSKAEGVETEVDHEKLAASMFGPARKTDLRAMVACDGELQVGVLFYYPGYDLFTFADGFHLSDMAVDEAYRGKGIGRKLMAKVAEENLAQGGEWVSFTVLHENDTAHAFHEALGMMQVPVTFFAAGKVRLAKMIADTK